MKVLLIEDDVTIADHLAEALRVENFVVDIGRTGEDGLHLGSTGTYDVVVLDLGLPIVSGAVILRTWRAADIRFPVLVLTARDGWSDKVDAFKAGADDYLTKPFRAEELIMRLRALVRRSEGHAATRLVCGALAFEVQTGAFELDGMPLKLTGLEWRVLSCLMLRKGVVVQRLDLLDRIYDGDAEVESNSLEVIVARLRRKVGAPAIQTVRGLGYRLMTQDA